MSSDDQPKRVLCSQCGQRGAVYKIGNEPVCIPCEHTFQQSRYMQFVQNAVMLNYASQEMDMIVGLGPRSPTIQIPNAPVPPIYYNNQHVNVSSSNVGSINLGVAQDIQASISILTEKGETNLADKLADLTNAIINDTETTSENQNELLEQTSFLSEQAKQNPDDRKRGAIRAIITSIKDGSMAIASAATAWESLEPILKSYFNI